MNRHRLIVRRKRINHRLQGLPWCHLNQHHLFLLLCRVDGRAVPRHRLMLARQFLIQLGGRPSRFVSVITPLSRTGGTRICFIVVKKRSTSGSSENAK